MTWDDPDVELEAAEREVSHWSKQLREAHEAAARIEAMLTAAVERRDEAWERLKQKHSL